MRSKKKNKKKPWKIPLIILCTIISIGLWLGFGDQGLIRLYRAEMELQAYAERNKRLAEENKALLKEIERLRKDMKYVESVARKSFNMIKSNEVIYKFGEKNSQEEDDAPPRNEAKQKNPEREKSHHE